MSTPASDDPARRRPRRRAVRRAGTVGDLDESLLRSTFPAAATPRVPATSGSGAGAPPRRHRAPDDEDTGWGRPADDSNDERLTRDRPPHW